MPKPQVTRLEDRSVPATLTGTVFSDSNGNGVRDPSELGLGGVMLDLDRTAAGTFAQQAVTDAGGVYRFENLAAGTHSIVVEPPAGAMLVKADALFTADVPADASTARGPDIALRSGGALKGVVFADLNANGQRDPGEGGVAGVPVSIDLRGDGTVDYTVTSGADGSFSVGNVPDANAVITVAPPAGYRRTQDSVLVNVSANNPGASALIGVSPSTGIGGRVTSALGGAGVAGATVSLDAVNGTAPVTTTTDADGNYLFANVQAGPHTVTVSAPGGARFVTADGTGTLNPVVSLIGATPVISGQDVAIQFAGSVTGKLGVPTGSLGGDVQGLAPASVQLDLNGAGKPFDVTPMRLADGSFRVDGIPDGTHTLIVTPPTGTTTTAPTRVQFTVQNGGAATVPLIPLLNTGSGTGSGVVTPPVTPPAGETPVVPPPPAPGNAGSNYGNQLIVGSGGGGSVRPYRFSANDDGTLRPVAGAPFVTPAGVGGVRVVMADFNGDGVDDTVTGTGPGESAVIRVYDGKTGAQLAQWEGFESKYTGGVNLAAADFNRDGKADIVVAADVGGGPRVRVFNSAQFQDGADPGQGRLIADFFAIEDAFFRGGVRVAAGDVNRDGFADLAVAAGVGGGPRVAVFDGRSVKVGQAPVKLGPDFFAFEPQLRNGAEISVGDVNGDGYADLVAGAGQGGAPRVVVFSGLAMTAGQGAKSARIADFYVNGDSTSRDGTSVITRDVDGDGKSDLIATDGTMTYVVTSKSIVNQYLNPSAFGPRVDAAFDAFGDSRGVNLG